MMIRAGQNSPGSIRPGVSGLKPVPIGLEYAEPRGTAPDSKPCWQFHPVPYQRHHHPQTNDLGQKGQQPCRIYQPSNVPALPPPSSIFSTSLSASSRNSWRARSPAVNSPPTMPSSITRNSNPSRGWPPITTRLRSTRATTTSGRGRWQNEDHRPTHSRDNILGGPPAHLSLRAESDAAPRQNQLPPPRAPAANRVRAQAPPAAGVCGLQSVSGGEPGREHLL